MNMDWMMTFLSSFWSLWGFVLFVSIILFAYWPGNRRRFEEAARIPLRADGQEG